MPPRHSTPKATAADVRAKLQRFNREPFLDVLEKILGAAPTIQSIQAFANKYPDRWAQALTIVSKLYGFHEKLEIDQNVHVHVHEMSDADLMHKLEDMRKQMLDATSDNMVLVGEVVEVGEEEEVEQHGPTGQHGPTRALKI